MSREEPKFCTCGSLKPASVSLVRTASTLAVCANVAFALIPPVKSMPRFRPRVANDTTEPIIRIADSVYHTLRVAMNGKRVSPLKNSTRATSDRQAGQLALAAIHQCNQGTASHERREQRCRNAECQHDRESADRACAEHPQHNTCDERGDVGIGDGRKRLLEARPDGSLRRDAFADFFTN